MGEHRSYVERDRRGEAVMRRSDGGRWTGGDVGSHLLPLAETPNVPMPLLPRWRNAHKYSVVAS